MRIVRYLFKSTKLVAKALVMIDPVAFAPRCPNVSIQDLHLNLILVDVICKGIIIIRRRLKHRPDYLLVYSVGDIVVSTARAAGVVRVCKHNSIYSTTTA